MDQEGEFLPIIVIIVARGEWKDREKKLVHFFLSWFLTESPFLIPQDEAIPLFSRGYYPCLLSQRGLLGEQ